jgi:hypothetical protein
MLALKPQAATRVREPNDHDKVERENMNNAVVRT